MSYNIHINFLEIFMKAGVIVCSDRSFYGEREDKSGPVICDFLSGRGFDVEYKVVPDDKDTIKEAIVSMVDDGAVLVLTSGGTGLAPRDVTPEATLEVVDKQVPGIAEAIRYESLKYTKNAMLSRGVSGVRGQSLIVNLAGSPKAASESLEIIEKPLLHAIGLVRGEVKDCGRN